MSEVKYLDKTGLGTVWGKVKALVSPKADKSEMSVTPGTGTDADKTTIQLKQGTSATVLTQHQDISGKADKDTDAVEGNLAEFDANGNPVDSGIAAGNVAQKDGSYDQMQVGVAKDLASSQSVPAEIVFRNTGGSTSVGKGGTAIIDRIKGKTLAWNQSVPNDKRNYTNTETDTRGYYDLVLFALSTPSTPVGGFTHLYIYSAQIVSTVITTPSNCNYITCKHNGASNDLIIYQVPSVPGHKYYFGQNVISVDPTTVGGLVVNDNDLVDLTLLYGTEIDGMTDAEILAKFESEYPGYHDYNPGTLISNDASAIETVGFNLYDSSRAQADTLINAMGVISPYPDYAISDYIECLPNTTYYLKNVFGNGSWNCGCFFDSAKNVLGAMYIVGSGASSGEVTTPDGCAYVILCLPNANIQDCCMSLSGPRNGEYEPYWKSVMQLGLNSVKVKSHNIWDEQWENGYYDTSTGAPVSSSSHVRCKNAIPCEPSSNYYIKYTPVGSEAPSLLYYDESGNFISAESKNGAFTTPSNCHYIKFYLGTPYGTTYNHDICINVSSSFNGQYEPHGDITITGGLKSAGDVRDEIVGNKYIQRVGQVDLGTLTWTLNTTYNLWSTTQEGRIPVKANLDAKTNQIAQFYVNVKADQSSPVVGTIGTNTWATSCNNGSTTIKPTGICYYELAEPIEYELVEAIQTEYRVDSHGTERRLPEDTASSVHAPFAADITYSTNIKETVENLPKNYINVDSMHAFLAALGTAMNGEWDMRQGNGRFIFTFTPNTPNTQNENE